MKVCKICNNEFTSIKINGAKITVRKRSNCFKCVPYKGKNLLRYCKYCNNKIQMGNICVKCDKHSYRNKLKYFAVMYKGGACIECGEKDISILVFHHINSDEKEHELSRMFMYNYKYTVHQIKDELDKCILLCPNCHSKKHVSDKTNMYKEFTKESNIFIELDNII